MNETPFKTKYVIVFTAFAALHTTYCSDSSCLSSYMAKNGKGNGKFVPEHAMGAYAGVTVYLISFLTSAIDGGRWSASRPG